MSPKAAPKKKPAANTAKKTKPACEGNAAESPSEEPASREASPTVESRLRAMHPEVPRSPGKPPALEDRKDQNVFTYLIVFDVVPAKAFLAHVVYVGSWPAKASPVKALYVYGGL